MIILRQKFYSFGGFGWFFDDRGNLKNDLTEEDQRKFEALKKNILKSGKSLREMEIEIEEVIDLQVPIQVLLIQDSQILMIGLKNGMKILRNSRKKLKEDERKLKESLKKLKGSGKKLKGDGKRIVKRGILILR